MRRSLMAIGLIICMFFLPGCGEAGKQSSVQPAMDFRAKLLNSNGATFTVEVEADYGEEVYTFELDCVYTTDGTTALTVVSPETIAGITAIVDNEKGTVSFGGTELTFGTLADNVVTPLAAPAILGRCWQNAYIAAAGQEQKGLRVSYEDGYEADELLIDTWFLAEGIPFYAEICYNKTCVLKLQISQFSFAGATQSDEAQF